MDIIQIEKLQAMKMYRKKKQFIPTLIHYLLSILMLGLFLSSPLWIFKLCYFISFTFSSLSLLRNIMSGPKCLFFLFNLIIIFLVGESKLSKSSSTPDIYEEYVKRNESLRKDRETKKEVPLVDQEKKGKDDDQDIIEKEEEEDEEMLVCDDEDRDGEEDEGMPLEELNRRAEDFIARVNMQRRLEASMLVSCD